MKTLTVSEETERDREYAVRSVACPVCDAKAGKACRYTETANSTYVPVPARPWADRPHRPVRRGGGGRAGAGDEGSTAVTTYVYIVATGERGEGQTPVAVTDTLRRAKRLVFDRWDVEVEKYASSQWMATIDGCDEVWIYTMRLDGSR